jgi:hypothetical protein
MKCSGYGLCNRSFSRSRRTYETKNRCLSKNISQLLRSIFHTFVIFHFLEPVHTPLYYICSYLTDMLRLIQNLIYRLTNNRHTDFRNTLTDCNISYYYRFHNLVLPANICLQYITNIKKGTPLIADGAVVLRRFATSPVYFLTLAILHFFCYTPYLYENFI